MALCVMGVASIAHAEEDESGAIFELAPGLRYVGVPGVRAGLQSPSIPVGASPDGAVGWGIDGLIGYALGDGPTVFGSADAAVRVRTAFASGTDTNTTLGGYGQMPIDGSGGSSGSGGPPYADSSFTYARYDVDLVYRAAVDLDSRVRTRGVFGVAYARLDQSHDFTARPFNGFVIGDVVNTNYVGAVIGTDGEADLTDSLVLDFGLETDLMAAMSDLSASQFFAGTVPIATDSQTDFAWRLRADVGLRWSFSERYSIGGQGTIDWGRIHTVEHPLYDALPFSSRLVEDTDLIVGVNATFTMLF